MSKDIDNLLQNEDNQKIVDFESRTYAPQSYYFNDGTDARTNLKLSGIVILEDSIFSALEVNGVDVLTAYNLSGKTVKTSLGVLFATGTKQITAYTLTSGYVCELIDEL